jgi:hypothetical protein
VLLEVVSIEADMDERGFYNVLYTYRGDGCGGSVDIVGLHRTIEAIKADNKSAVIVGLLPQPKIRERKA